MWDSLSHQKAVFYMLIPQVHSTPATTKLVVAQGGEMSKESSNVPSEIQPFTPIFSPPTVGPTAPPQALPIAFLEDWRRITERVSN